MTGDEGKKTAGFLAGLLQDIDMSKKISQIEEEIETKDKEISVPEPPPTVGDSSVSVFEFLSKILNGMWEMSGRLPHPTLVKRNQIAIEQLQRLMRERNNFGVEKYGTSLMTNNGRDVVEDMRQELGDLLMYGTQAIMEGKKDINLVLDQLGDVHNLLLSLSNEYGLTTCRNPLCQSCHPGQKVVLLEEIGLQEGEFEGEEQFDPLWTCDDDEPEGEEG